MLQLIADTSTEAYILVLFVHLLCSKQRQILTRLHRPRACSEIMASVLALRTFASLTLSRVTRNPRFFHNSPAGMILLLSLYSFC